MTTRVKNDLDDNFSVSSQRKFERVMNKVKKKILKNENGIQQSSENSEDEKSSVDNNSIQSIKQVKLVINNSLS